MQAAVTKSRKKIRLLIVDDHPVVRKGIWGCLAKNERVEVVGEASDGDEALAKTRELAPDVVLMDISMPKMNGLAVTEVLRKEFPKSRVLILSMHLNRDYVLRIIQSGARGYVLKEASPEELVRAIESVMTGDAFFSPNVARIALNQYVDEKGSGKTNPLSRLTDREREVLAHIAGDLSNKEIADKLGVGVRTIETHRERIMRKLDIHSVVGLTKFAIANRLVDLETPEQV